MPALPPTALCTLIQVCAGLFSMPTAAADRPAPPPPAAVAARRKSFGAHYHRTEFLTLAELPVLAVDFKRPIYEVLARSFARFARPA